MARRQKVAGQPLKFDLTKEPPPLMGMRQVHHLSFSVSNQQTRWRSRKFQKKNNKILAEIRKQSKNTKTKMVFLIIDNKVMITNK